MKLLTLFFFIFFLLSCTKEDDMIVIKDCTGTYLRKNDKDFKVCNEELLDKYEDEQVITVSYKRADEECEKEGFVCELYHKFEHYIEIETVK